MDYWEKRSSRTEPVCGSTIKKPERVRDPLTGSDQQQRAAMEWGNRNLARWRTRVSERQGWNKCSPLGCDDRRTMEDELPRVTDSR
jgi:hypothetical protein